MVLVAFDFDGTLVKGDAGVHFGRHLLLKGYLGAFDGGLVRGTMRVTRLNANTAFLTTKGALLHWRYARGDLDRHGLVKRAYAMFKGLDSEWVSDEMASYATKHLPGKLRMDSVRLMRDHAAKGHHVVVLSTGVRDLIWPLRDVLGIDFEVVACRLREVDGTLTGTVEGPLNGTEKAIRLLALSKRRGHELEEAHAYTDHEDDAVILEMVGKPGVIHPTRKMAKLARENGWPIVQG